jgi:hypothetical protein
MPIFKHLGVLMTKNLCNLLLIFRAFSWLKNPFNQRNPRLINDLRENKALYNCRETFTDVMSALQIRPFLTNKPNFRKSQMNVSKVLTRDYDKMDTWSIRKNKPNSNPIQTQFKANPIQTQTNPISKVSNAG